MDQPENVIENFRVVRILLEPHQLVIDRVETLVGFGQKFPANRPCNRPSGNGSVMIAPIPASVGAKRLIMVAQPEKNALNKRITRPRDVRHLIKSL
jgi:hypothetical protein